MEGITLTPDEPAEKPESSPEGPTKKKSKKRAGELGIFAVEADPKPKKKLEERIEAVAAETEPVPEAQAPDEELGEAEVPAVEAEATKIQAELDPEPPEEVQQFREKIIEEGKDSETAFQEVMTELGEKPEEQPDEEVPDEAPITPASPPPRTPSGGAPAGGGPPHGPVPPFGPAFGPPPPGGPHGTAGFNAPPVAPTPEREPHVPEYHQANPAAMALFGGIIGYLIGRRRGRIKTEKKLLPIQKKLEKQVEDLQWQIQEKENKIRRVVARKAQLEAPAPREASLPSPVMAAEKDEPMKTERREAPEAIHLHSPKKAPEHIGQMLISAEAKPENRSQETNKPIKHEAEEKVISKTDRQIETLNRADLLAMSEKIVVEGSSLRQIYETHLVSEKGLRRLIAEHLRGGDLTRALRREVVEREIDFERDPAMRDVATPSASIATGGGTATLDKLYEKAAASISSDDDQAAFSEARAAYEDQQNQKQHRRLADISLVSIIAILFSVVVYLILRG